MSQLFRDAGADRLAQRFDDSLQFLAPTFDLEGLSLPYDSAADVPVVALQGQEGDRILDTGQEGDSRRRDRWVVG